MVKETVDEAALPQNLSDEQLANAKHAATFPPNTPHSVINQFKEPVEPVKPADPRETPKEKKKKDE
jgi:hypothetical protein